MTRTACAGRFVFKVVASVPQDWREPVATPNGLGLEYAFKLLTARDLPAQSDAAFHELIAQAVQQMEWTSNPGEYRGFRARVDAFVGEIASKPAPMPFQTISKA